MYSEKIGKITLHGKAEDVQEAKRVLSENLRTWDNEPLARLELQKMLDDGTLKAIKVSYEGNTVWARTRIVAAVKKVIRKGMGSMTDELYHFLSLRCGSIAHFNKAGWIAEYPTIGDLKAFFARNEFGVRVFDHIPRWDTDSQVIVLEIEKLLGITGPAGLPERHVFRIGAAPSYMA